jgi:hypothetical protein
MDITTHSRVEKLQKDLPAAAQYLWGWHVDATADHGSDESIADESLQNLSPTHRRTLLAELAHLLALSDADLHAFFHAHQDTHLFSTPQDTRAWLERFTEYARQRENAV